MTPGSAGLRHSLAILALGLGACATHPPAPTPAPAPRPAQAPASAPAPAAPKAKRNNPLLEPSPLPFHYPQFDEIQDRDFEPAFEAGLARRDEEVAAIANASAPPSFENTIVAMERSGRLLNRVEDTFFNLASSNLDPEKEKIEAKIVPELSAHDDAIMLDPKLFARVDALYKERAKLHLDPEAAQLLDRYEKDFVRAGARLDPADKKKLALIDEALSSLSTRFQQNLLHATAQGAVVVDDVKALDGLSPEEIGAAAEAAKARGLTGKWVITLQNTTIQPTLAELKDRALRKRIFEASVSRARSGKYDNTSVVVKILKLRAEKARLLGYESFAAYALADETAGTPAAVNRILRELVPSALAQARREAAELQRRIDRDAKASHQKPFALEPWDWAFYAREVRDARFHFDDAEVKPYFELNHVLEDGVFYAAHLLYGITFKERHDLPVYRPSVRVFEVDDADGSPLGLIVLDYFKRDSKQGGAWMDTYVSQSTLLGDKAVVVNNLNIPKPAPGQPALLTFDEVTTMFHEFGHGLHALFSSVRYPRLAGTNVPPDFVEFPSQFNEAWARDPGVVAHFARNDRTGAPMPKALLAKVLAAKNDGEGYALLEYLEAAMLDQAWHQTPEDKLPAAAGVMAFERRALKKDGVAYGPVPPRYHTPYFAHIFEGGYAAGYYAYLWAEILARDADAWVYAHGGLCRKAGDVFRAKILSRGRTEPPRVLFRSFYGRAPDIGPLLEYHGLKLPKRRRHR